MNHAAGEGFLSNNTGTLVRDNDVTSGACTFHRHVESAITVTGDNAPPARSASGRSPNNVANSR